MGLRWRVLRQSGLRVAAALSWPIFGAISLLLPILLCMDEPELSAYQPFWSIVRFYVPTFIAEALFVALAYLLLRYALTSDHPEDTDERTGWADRFFKNLAVACGSVAIFSLIAQLCFAAVEIWSIREHFPEGARPGWDWISLWRANMRSPVFWLLALVVFVSALYWEHRRSVAMNRDDRSTG
jgi:hypothetical protein